MKTDDLVAMLARNAEPVAGRAGRARWCAVGGIAVLVHPAMRAALTTGTA